MTNPVDPISTPERAAFATTRRILAMLSADRLALASAIFLVVLVLAVVIVPATTSDAGMNLALRNWPPFTLTHGLGYVLGGDTLGRPILVRLLEGGRGTLTIAISVVAISALVGAALGLVAGFFGRWVDSVIMRVGDVVMSFPSLLLAVIVLYMFRANVANVILVLAITRFPVYVRVTRAETMEVRERLFIDGARTIGATDLRIICLHIAPIVIPTVVTVASLDFASVMLSESALSFLGIGVQPPATTWGQMVASGRDYLSTAWWLAFWPGLIILLTALAANLLSNWLRVAMDPSLRWRLETGGLSRKAARAQPEKTSGGTT